MEPVTGCDQQFGHSSDSAHCGRWRRPDRQRTMDSSSSTNFQRKISLASGVAFVVGIIIGSGIFVSPKGVFQNADCNYTGASVVWVLSGMFSMLGALVYSELGTTIVRSGGDYAYLKAGFGSFVSFLYLWINLVAIRPASQAILALTCAYYLLEPFKSLCDSWDFEAITRIISALLIALLGYINCVNVKSAIQLQNIFTVLKVLALAIIIVVGIGFYALGGINGFNEPGWDKSECKHSYSLSIYSGLFAFGGWNYLNIVTDELKDPYKNLPRSAFFGILFTTVIYVLANVAYFLTLTPFEILNSPAIALTFAGKVIGPFGLLPISLAISASAAGSLNANLFTSSRLVTNASLTITLLTSLFCMGAQEKHLPSVLAMLHVENCTPVVSIFVSGLLTLIWLQVRNIYQIIQMFSFAYWQWTGITVASGIYLRHCSPQLERPIKLPLLIHWSFVFLCLLLTLLAVYNDWYSSLIGLVLILLGVPIYMAKSLATNKLRALPTTLTHINYAIQKMFLIVETSAPEVGSPK